MVSIIIAASDEAKAAAKAHGFTEQTVLVRMREEAGTSCPKVKARIEGEIMREIRPYQFAVTDYWGAGPG